MANFNRREIIPPDAIELFADGLTLVYHEVRHVRLLIRAGHVQEKGWKKFVNLPKNRIKALGILQPLRQAARSKSTAREASRLFQRQFGCNLDELRQLYENANWKHAAAVGGHAWRHITAFVSSLGDAIDAGDAVRLQRASTQLLEARHNTGSLRDKILELDQAIEVVTDEFWR